MAASLWLASVSISASSALTASASTSSSLSRAARCIRAARDCRKLCSNRERRFSLGRSIIERILKGLGLFHNSICRKANCYFAYDWLPPRPATPVAPQTNSLRYILGSSVAVEHIGGNCPQRRGILRLRKNIKGGTGSLGVFI